MKKFKNIIKCPEYTIHSLRKKDFEVAKYVFDYKTNLNDQKIIDKIIADGIKLSNDVNPNAANNGNTVRDKTRLQNNAIAGLLAEFLWLDFIYHHNINCNTTKFEEAKNQIDILLSDTNKKVEVRSSFPRNGLKFALCHHKYQFDVIGPYMNDYKPNEIQKDFYVRTLFPFQQNELMDKIKNDNFIVYLTGGATWQMMNNKNIAITKNFIPEDELSINRLKTASTYIVIPFSNAMDTFEIVNLMKT